jgi:hypothetical protein
VRKELPYDKPTLNAIGGLACAENLDYRLTGLPEVEGDGWLKSASR